MSRKSYPNVNAANQYARNVVRGKIPACQFVIQACQRHIDDMAAEKSKKFRYRFDKDMAEKAAKFIQLLPHTKGEWAFKRMPITLEAWQLFIVCCAFGWVQKGSKLRRFREVYTEIPRKNGKSAISAGVALYCFTCDNEFGAEVYSGATTEKQAWEVFRPARLMCKRTPLLVEAFGIEVNASNLNRPEDGARFEPLIGNPGDGASPHCAIVDEYHEHPTDSLYTTMLTGMGARRQPLMWAITTAGYNIEGPCYDKRREVIEMLNGTVPVVCSMTGMTGNMDDGEALSLVTPVNGLPSGGMADTIAGGFDIEDLEVWRARVLERYYWTPQGGADGDYVVWAKEVPGVTRAWTYRHWMGTGTVGVMIASSDLINPILDDTTVAAAQDHIEPLAPVAGSDLYVFKATPKIIDFTIDLNPDNETTRAAVKAELLSFLLRDGYPEGTLELSRINEAISIAAGERSHTLISPAVDTPIAKNELAVMGDIVWA